MAHDIQRLHCAVKIDSLGEISGETFRDNARADDLTEPAINKSL